MTTPIFPDLPHPAYLNLTHRLTPAEIVNFALNTHPDVTATLLLHRNLPTAHRIHLDFVRELIDVRFLDSTMNFAISFNPERPKQLQITTANVLKAMINVASRLQSIFGGNIGAVTLDLKKIDEANCHRLNALACETLITKGFSRTVKGAKMAEVIRNINVTEDLILESELGEFYCPSLEDVTLNNYFMLWANGFTGESLVKLIGKAKRIELMDSTLTDKDVHDFINTWLQGTEHVTSFLSVTRENENKWNLENILEGIEILPFRRESRDRFYISTKNPDGTPLNIHDLTTGKDFRRGDGLLASVTEERKTVIFCVFHDPHEIRKKREEKSDAYTAADERRKQAERVRDQLQGRFERIHETIQEEKEKIAELESADDRNELVLRAMREHVVALENEGVKLEADVSAAGIKATEMDNAQIRAAFEVGMYNVLR